MVKYILLCFGVFAVALSSVKALTKDELANIETGMLAHFHECNKQFGITDEELKAAKEEKKIDGIDACLIGCVFKRAQFINDKGLFDAEKITELSKNYLKGEEDLKTVAEIIKDCTKVNDEKVTDGDEGCERAKMLLACFGKHKDELKPVSRR